MTDIAALIKAAETDPPKPVIQGLLNESEIAGLHGAPEVFKTVFSLQLADSLASGKTFLDVWRVPKARVVYFFETEMSAAALGTRLQKMYSKITAPTGIHFADETQLRRFRRAGDLESKFALLRDWVSEAEAEVLIIDTANPFFRGRQSPNDETTAGAFFDLLEALPVSVKLFVRHNHKPRIDDTAGDAAAKIRGSGQFSDVPDLLLELRRTDKRTNEAVLSVSKFRAGSKPGDLNLWLDEGSLRLISVPPVIHLLEAGPRSRPDLIHQLKVRFGIEQRRADELIKEQQIYLSQTLKGHTRMFDIDWSASGNAEWRCRVRGIRGTGRDMQGCINSSVSLSPRDELEPEPCGNSLPETEGIVATARRLMT
jgi:hypothetical protein